MTIDRLADYVISNGRVLGDPDTHDGVFTSSLIEEMLYELYFDEYDQWDLDVTREDIEEWVYTHY